MTTPPFHSLTPGAVFENDWHNGLAPANIEVGPNTVMDSSYCFKHYRSQRSIGLRVGRDVTFWRTSLSVGVDGYVEIGDGSYLENANLVCSCQIVIGCSVLIAGGVTIVDSDFHPVDPARRLADTVALSPSGDRARRPSVQARPVRIGDDVWIGYHATILKGVTIGSGAVVEPGSLVSRDVPPGTIVEGNPARAQRPGSSGIGP